MRAHTLTDTYADAHAHTSEENLETWQQIQVFLFIDLLFILTALNFNSSPAVFMDLCEIILFPPSFFTLPVGLLELSEVVQSFLKDFSCKLNHKMLSEMS